ncbi:sensor histidine kinase [Zhouia sp. PK063]|uniref:sensor histidine kinase n=1 Tax=Zhouia sp. PK063 TaxID=3373602 RepID=UPI0037AD0247
MSTAKRRSIIRWVLILGSFIIVALILWNTYIFFQKFKHEERQKMKVWASAQAEFLQTTDLNKDIGVLTLEVLKSNTSTPMILVSAEGQISSNNIETKKVKDSIFYTQKIKDFVSENNPIEISYQNEKLATLYYGNSDVLNKLKYYPIALMLIIFLFATVVYFFYKTSKVSEQNKLWAGMAKETAHQIGTPLSSLLGWTEILKTQDVDEDITSEIEKDIARLQIITDRFSKIGSVPKLERQNVVEETRGIYQYLEKRSSKLVNFSFETEKRVMFAKINPQLFSWTIENLVKNAIDAMRGKGDLKISVFEENKQIKINITDSGKGIPKGDFKIIFEPGITTKKRGWGLGLSLVKRIIEDYHDGKVKVLSSQLEKGTTMQISLTLID